MKHGWFKYAVPVVVMAGAMVGVSTPASALLMQINAAIAVSDDPSVALVWDLDCDIAFCVDGGDLDQNGLVSFTFAQALDGNNDPIADEITITMIAENLGPDPGGDGGLLTTIAMELPTDFIDLFNGKSGASSADGANILGTIDTTPGDDWAFGYRPEAINIGISGKDWDVCLGASAPGLTGPPGDKSVNCLNANPAQDPVLDVGDLVTFVFNINLSQTIASLIFDDFNSDQFSGLSAFKGLFADAIVNDDNGDSAGICSRWQAIGDQGDSAKVCGVLRSNVVVPEPMTLGLLGLGLLGLGLGAVRRRRAA